MGVLLELIHGVAPHVADRDPAVLRELADDLDEFLAALFAELREEQPDDLALNRWREAQVALLNGLLNGVQRIDIPGLYDKHPRLGRGIAGHRAHANLRAIALHHA